MAESSAQGSGNSGGKRKFDQGGGGKSAQKHKIYKYRDAGGRGGRGGGDRGRGRGGGRGGGAGFGGDRDGETGKVFPMDRYRTKPLPEMLTSPGICVTTVQNRERSAEQELMEYLEQIADELYPETADVAVKEEPDSGDVDFEEMLKRELDTIKGDGKSKRFSLCAHDIICVIYINVLPPLDPHRLVRHILEQAETTSRCPLRFCKRILPISSTCPATLKQLSDTAATLVKSAFSTPDQKPLKFAIDTNSRNSDKLERMSMIQAVAQEVSQLNAGHSVDLKNPDRTILVEVFRNTLGMTVLEDYERFKKYNPNSVATQAAKNRHQQTISQSTAEPTAQPEERQSGSSSPTTNRKHANRGRKAAALADAGPSVPANEPTKKSSAGEEVSNFTAIEEVEDGEIAQGGAELVKAHEEII
ncbi:hypothetical protein CI109_103641 [Kwoniella shandongensis]|uniref:THUMP domain-containing protein n=1 Tax=Kwoniella shandongensis TaxID=1734106 RepID=A0AAJ8LH72_9TREE